VVLAARAQREQIIRRIKRKPIAIGQPNSTDKNALCSIRCEFENRFGRVICYKEISRVIKSQGCRVLQVNSGRAAAISQQHCQAHHSGHNSNWHTFSRKHQ
jgi:hypothetical protein